MLVISIIYVKEVANVRWFTQQLEWNNYAENQDILVLLVAVETHYIYINFIPIITMLIQFIINIRFILWKHLHATTLKL